jgi:hypothetical protein
VTITEFLEARIAEDEAVARECEDSGRWSAWRHEEGLEWWVSSENFGHVVTTGYVGNNDARPNAEHMARWDPARVLAECAAKRAILAECRPGTLDDLDCSEDDQPAPMWVARALAAVYSDHPDYDKDWTL